MDKKLYKKLLTLVPLFKNLTPGELEAIVRISKLLKVRKGVTVIEEEDDGAAMYIMVEGKAEVVKRLPGGDTTRLAELEAPTVFGEMALIDKFPRSASVVTQTETMLFQINEDPNETTDLAAKRPDVVKALLKDLKAFRALRAEKGLPPYGQGRQGFQAPKDWGFRKD